MRSAGEQAAAPPLSAGYRFAPNSLADAIGDVFAGGIVAIMNIAIAMSFAALVFRDVLQAGYPIGLWSILITVIVVGLIVGWLTSMPPLSASPDTAVVTAIGFLATAISQPLLSRGVAGPVVIDNIMVGVVIVTVVTGVVFVLIGSLRLGQALRFVPFPLVNGFLAATGVLLMLSATTIVVGKAVSISEGVPAAARVKLLVMIAIAVALWGLPKLFRSALTGPLTFVLLVVGLNGAISHHLLSDPKGWYLLGIGGLVAWSPFSPATLRGVDWRVIVAAIPDILTCAAIGLLSIIVKVASLETRRGEIADLDHELRVTGIACLACGPVGGFPGMLGSGGSELFIDSGARTRLAAAIATLAVVAAMVLRIDLAGLVATPLLGGILMRSGFSLSSDAILRIIRQRSVIEIALTVMITLICVRFGYDAGIVVGFVAACLMFAFSYGRIGVIRRHVTRASIHGGVDRPPEQEALLRRHGDAIHLYSLSGYIFFGSAEAVFETIRSTVKAQTARQVRFIILDLGAVTGMDGSTASTLAKLEVFADRSGISVAFTNVAPPLLRRITGSRPRTRGTSSVVFADNIDAFAWCEVLLLKEVAPESSGAERVAIEQWLSAELGYDLTKEAIATFFERRTIAADVTIYRQGEMANTIDFIDSGALALNVADSGGRVRPLRVLTQRTVIGEMGFFRGSTRSASISAQTPATLYTLTVGSFERLQRDDPALHQAMLTFFIRTLADRVERAQVEIAALRH